MIKTIFLDLGGVLIDLSMARCKASFAALGVAELGELLDTSLHKGIFGKLEGGEIDEREFYRLCRGFCPNDVTDGQISDALSSLLVTVPLEKIEYLRELKDRYPLYALSNNNPINVKKTCQVFDANGLPYDEVFLKSFFSHEMKMLKPEPAIFEEAIRVTGYDPSEILFVDDSPANAQGAAEVGLNSLHYVPGTDLRAAIENKLAELNK